MFRVPSAQDTHSPPTLPISHLSELAIGYAEKGRKAVDSLRDVGRIISGKSVLALSLQLADILARRNERCIGCSALRPAIPGMVPYSQASPTIANPVMPVAIQNHPISALSPTSPLSVNGAAPRFRSHPSISPMSPSNAQSTGPYHQPNAPYPHHLGSHQPQFATPINPPAPSTAQPPYLPASEYLKLLTPSGHALAIGGRVRNISSNPMTPCVIWWPDNERLPDPGCVRPLICGSVCCNLTK